MKTLNFSLATVVLGALAVSYSACGAQGEDNTVPGGAAAQAGSPSSAGSAGSPGSAGTPTVGASGAPTIPSAGAPAALGGGFNTGVGGATTSGGAKGVGTAGAATGGAGAPATVGGCKVAAGTLADALIDNLEDGDNVIRPIGSRTGYWYTYNDGTGTQVPPPTMLFKGTAPGSTATPLFAAVTSGPAFTKYGAGMGFDLNNVAMKSCPYDATAYSGIKFWAKAGAGNAATMTLTAMVKTSATTATTDGGTCAAMCDDHYTLKPPPALSATWTQYMITFAGPATAFGQNSFGTPVAFDKTKLLGMQFQVGIGVAFDFAIDDIEFF